MGRMVSVALFEMVLYLAVILAVVLAATAVVVIGKSWVVWPSGTVMVDGTDATDGTDEVRAMVAPPFGAGPVRTTVPVEFREPGTVAGFRVTWSGQSLTV